MQCEVRKWSECFYASLSSVLLVFTLSLIINTKDLSLMGMFLGRTQCKAKKEKIRNHV